MGNNSECAVDSELASKLQAGERVWLKRNWRNIAPAAICTLVPLSAVAMTYRQDLSTVLLLGFFGPYAAWLWVRALANRLRFTEATVEATDQNWGLSQHRIRLEDVVAARVSDIGLDVRILRVTNSRYCVYVYQLTPGRGSGSRWVSLWITPYEVKASTLLAELRRRCELTEISPMSRDLHTTVWQRPGLLVAAPTPPSTD